ncbi:hypothetical protein BKA67DRAFT_529372 [Truncatella angustata]|uniref:Uncharacterized protein n=1 Tax=Truncatella angustata TaxID=152316 RepID=A0A9P8UVZ8_9PEZI|nr:uncharacterized protein BKA67DRAFT_529372 [Truncatella angustata]KAH6659198.1 hypothetical protein BKA67DRAFT_529372 [Truncatella angustata]
MKQDRAQVQLRSERFPFVECKRVAADEPYVKPSGLGAPELHQHPPKTSKAAPVDSSANLGTLQRYIDDRRHELAKKQWQIFEQERKRLEEWQHVECDERCAKKDVMDQIQSWVYLENKQIEERRRLRLQQNSDFEDLIASWDAAREGVLRQHEPWSASETGQRR